VIVDEYALVLPSDLAAGEYTIRVGLYTADDGTRLAVQDQNGDVPDGDHFILPVIVTIDEGQ
jgi:hypothetical protein